MSTNYDHYGGIGETVHLKADSNHVPIKLRTLRSGLRMSPLRNNLELKGSNPIWHSVPWRRDDLLRGKAVTQTGYTASSFASNAPTWITLGGVQKPDHMSGGTLSLGGADCWTESPIMNKLAMHATHQRRIEPRRIRSSSRPKHPIHTKHHCLVIYTKIKSPVERTSSVSGLSWNVMYTVQARHVAGADRWAKRCTSEFGLHRAVVKISEAWIDQLSTRSYWPGSGHGGRRQTPHGKGDYG
ncbi:hypothetical protein BXZ70DRAFT_911443 [Cristinia sonorae]|uniref:Uncharacterized protein n=1 Tax=Cristinia sonorae TaxID=1940300 RepID=A0A8K0XJM1_9AGAR|nr:hypothetical protein BXZ70DRAFT_911443 [Cristinia sonorae]